ncbi:membrane protein insertion efficiency factor YidD [Candidatus Giovannonibacteria bacterium]|nr:membrane protein insertion efficiency factor YidD [Candidatus Giovannonibacteria bacterium]
MPSRPVRDFLKNGPKKIAIGLISFYQIVLSPDQGIFSNRKKYCVFYPSCSQYTKEAIKHGGFFYGIKRGVFRIVRCHPFQKNYFDPFRP